MVRAETERLADLAVPGLPMMLDDARLAGWLAARTTFTLTRRNYLRYKPGTSCVLGLETDRGPAFAIAVSAAGRPKLDKYLERAGDAVLTVDRDRGLLLGLPAADRHLPALGRSEQVSGRPAVPDPATTTLAYKPQRRWVGRPETDPTVLIRAYARGGSVDAAARVQGFAGAPVPVPTLVAAHHRSSVLALDFRLGRPAGPGDLAAAGRALARLHRWQPPGPLPARPAVPWRASALAAATLLPELAPRIRALLTRIEAGGEPFAPAVPGHGDFSLDQLVVDPDGRICLLDLDRAGTGSAVADLASAAAAGLDDAQQADLLAGYGSVPPGLNRAVAVAILARLTEPFRSCRDDWPAGIAQRLERAERACP